LDKPVPDQAVKKILELANLAPSAGNLQARRAILVKDQKMKNQLAQAANNQDFISQAPVVLVVCAVPEESAIKYGDRGRKLYAFQDATIFTAYLQLAAVKAGLATCWVGAFNDEQVGKILSLPENLKPVAILPLGFAGDEPPKKLRKDLSEIVIFR